MQVQCPRCKGTGKDPEIIAECGKCHGRGHVSVEMPVEVHPFWREGLKEKTNE